MKMVEINDFIIHLQQNQAFVYFSNGDSDVLYIDNIENKEDPKEDIIRELEFRGRESIATHEVVFLI